MNTLSYEFKKDAGLTTVPRGDYEIVLDGRKTGYFFDIAALALSADKNGIYPMLVGACETLGCCGAYAEVVNGKHTVVWEKLWNGQSCGEPEPDDELKEFKFYDDFIIKPPLIFNQKEYKALADKLVEEIKKSPERFEEFTAQFEKYKLGDKFRI